MCPHKAARKCSKVSGGKTPAKPKKSAQKNSVEAGEQTSIASSRPWYDEDEELLASLWMSETHNYDPGSHDRRYQVRAAALKHFCEKLGRVG